MTAETQRETAEKRGGGGKFAKGSPGGPGRPKGMPNKLTASIRSAIADAFEKLGGVTSLVEWGRKNPDEFYKLWGRLAPSEVEHTTPDGPVEVKVTHQVVDPSVE